MLEMSLSRSVVVACATSFAKSVREGRKCFDKCGNLAERALRHVRCFGSLGPHFSTPSSDATLIQTCFRWTRNAGPHPSIDGHEATL